MQTVTKKFSQEHGMSKSGYKWFCKKCLNLTPPEQVMKLFEYKPILSNWLMTRLLSIENIDKYIFHAAYFISIVKSMEMPGIKEYTCASTAAEFAAASSEIAKEFYSDCINAGIAGAREMVLKSANNARIYKREKEIYAKAAQDAFAPEYKIGDVIETQRKTQLIIIQYGLKLLLNQK